MSWGLDSSDNARFCSSYFRYTVGVIVVALENIWKTTFINQGRVTEKDIQLTSIVD